MILKNMSYQYYDGRVYKVVMQALNEDEQEMVVYVGEDDSRVWVCHADEFEQNFIPYLPFGTVLHADDKQFVVTHNGLDYVRLYCDETAEEYELKLVDVKSHHVLNWVVVITYDNKTKITYQFVVKL